MMFTLYVMESPILGVSINFWRVGPLLDENKKLIEDTRLFEEEYEFTWFLRGFHLDFF